MRANSAQQPLLKTYTKLLVRLENCQVPEKIKPVRGYLIKAKGDQLELDDAQRGNTSEGVIIGNPWGYISDVNDFIVSLYGAKDKSEIVGKHVLQFLAGTEKSRATASSLKSIEIGKARTEIYVVRLKNGQEKSFEVFIDFIENEDGEKMGFVDIIRPI